MNKKLINSLKSSFLFIYSKLPSACIFSRLCPSSMQSQENKIVSNFSEISRKKCYIFRYLSNRRKEEHLSEIFS